MRSEPEWRRFWPGADAYHVKRLLYRRPTGSFGHTAEVQGLLSLTAALRLEPAAQIRNFDLPDRVAAFAGDADRGSLRLCVYELLLTAKGLNRSRGIGAPIRRR